MASKSLVFVSVFIAAIAAASMTQVQGTIPVPIPVVAITGAVSCSTDSIVNGTTSPPFPNAQVQLRCNGIVVASATTNRSGLFLILSNPPITGPSSVANNCNLTVTTSLRTCNATLPAGGTLTSALQFVARTVVGLVQFYIYNPVGFQLQLTT